MIARLAFQVVGLFLVLFGLWMGLTVLTFASTIDPSLPEFEWWKAYWDGMDRGGGWTNLGIASGIIALGVGLMVIPSKIDGPPRPTRSKKARDAEIE